MASTLNEAAIQSFHMTFQNTYEDTGKLRNATQIQMGVVGDAYTWPEMGESVFTEKGAAGTIIPQSDTVYSKVVTTFTPFSRLEAVDDTKQAEVQQNIITNLAKKYAIGMGRREDQVLINAMVNATLPASNTIATGSLRMTVDKIVEAGVILDYNNVPEENRFLALTSYEIQDLMAAANATDSRYTNSFPLMAGGMDNFFGFKIIKIGSRTEGGLPDDGSTRTCLAWQSDALGLAYNLNPKVKTDYSVERVSNIAVGLMQLGADVLQTKGVVKILIDLTA